MEKNQFLAKLNDIGAKIGYPFYVYADGTFSKTVISANREKHAVMAVKRPFLVEELATSSPLGEADCLLGQLNAIGEQLGYPFYVYADGTCGTQPKNGEKGFLFSLKLIQKIEAEELQEAQLPALVREALHPLGACNAEELAVILQFAEKPEVWQWMGRDKWCNGAVNLFLEYGLRDELKDYMLRKNLPADEELALVCSGDVELIWLYIRNTEFGDKAESQLVSKGEPLLVKAYVTAYALTVVAQIWLIKRADCELMSFFATHRSLSIFVEKYLIESHNEALIAAYIGIKPLSGEGEEMLVRLDNKNLVDAYLAKHGRFTSLDAEVYAKRWNLL